MTSTSISVLPKGLWVFGVHFSPSKVFSTQALPTVISFSARDEARATQGGNSIRLMASILIFAVVR